MSMSTESVSSSPQRARHRLIGTAAWLILAAVVLPWVFDAMPRNQQVSAQGEMQVRMVGNHAVIVEAPKPILTRPAAPIQAQTAVVALPVSTFHAALLVNNSANPLISSSVTSSTNGQIVGLKQDAAGAKSTLALQTIHSNQVVSTVHASSDTPPRPIVLHIDNKFKPDQQVLEQKPDQVDAKNTVTSGGAHQLSGASSQYTSVGLGYVVQLGVYHNLKHVAEMRQRLRDQGIATYVETMPSGALRVRSGPFSQRKQAENVLANIRLADLPAQIVPLGKK